MSSSALAVYVPVSWPSPDVVVSDRDLLPNSLVGIYERPTATPVAGSMGVFSLDVAENYAYFSDAAFDIVFDEFAIVDNLWDKRPLEEH